MDFIKISEKCYELSALLDIGEFESAFIGVEELFQEVSECGTKNSSFFKVLSNIAGLYIDIGSMQPNFESAQKGLSILKQNKDKIIPTIGEDLYYYNLSNAKSNLIKEKNHFKNDFSTIEQLVEIKNDLWQAVKLSSTLEKTSAQPTYIVNLGNALKKQFRIVEALECYDSVISLNIDIPQAWLNRSETLLMLNTVSNTFSIQMLEQIKNGYRNVISSTQIPPQWISYYQQQIEFHQNKIDEYCCSAGIKPDIHDTDKTKNEFIDLSCYRKFCLNNNLTLSEHGLYCACAASARDNLTILTTGGVVGDFVVPMEMVLNRLKSEFSFARHLYFEYLTGEFDEELFHESCFSELYNDELLGVDVEKLRTAFRVCFGILDKIGVAICELFDLYPPSQSVYFQSFWQLDHGDRREYFNKHKNPGLLALYSIATDLNHKKDGEWSFLKQWRNDLEHEFVVVYKSETPNDLYDSYTFLKNVVFIKENVFIQNLKRLLQLTRSAIFSFVFTVRDKALKEITDDNPYVYNKIGPINSI